MVHILLNCFQNDVHATSAPTPLCSDVCSIVASGWFDLTRRTDLKEGLLYCCTLEVT